MRWLIGFGCVLALGAVPLSAGAQGTDKSWLEEFYPELAPRESTQPQPREPASEPTPEAPAAEPTPEAPMIEAPPEQPASQLELDDAGVEVAPPPDGAGERSAFSSELRFQLTTNAYRWSSYVPERSGLPDYGKRSLHFTFGLGARFFPKSAHGVLIDFEYRLDGDFDSPPRPGFCLVNCPPDLWLSTYFTLAHVGYAYRHVVPGPRDPKRLAWAFTPHASLSAGSSETEPGSDTSGDFIVARSRSPVVGARFGIDVDLHIKRFFLGWTLGYEILKHTSGPLRVSHFMNFNFVPVIGAVLGAKVQTKDPSATARH